MPARTPRRQRRPVADATRRRLLRAARRAFAMRGLDGASLADHILGPARVSVGSFYHQFDHKTDLLLALLDEESAAWAGRLFARGDDEPPPASLAALCERALARTLERADASPQLFRIRRRERTSTDARVRRRLQRDRQRELEALRRDLVRLSRAEGLRLPAARLAPLWLTLAESAAEAGLGLPRRRRDLAPLVRFATGGALALGASPSAARRPPATPARAGR